MRHFDVANRNRKRFTFLASVMPGGMIGFNASAGVGRDEYPDSPHGLQSYDSDQYSIGMTVAPDPRFDLTASYGWENYASLQRSRTASSADEQAQPTRDWTTDYAGEVNFFEAAFNINAFERTAIRLIGRLEQVERHLSVWHRAGLAAGRARTAAAGHQRTAARRGRSGLRPVAQPDTSASPTGSRITRCEDFALGPTVMSGIAFPPVEPGQAPVATNALLLGYQYRPYTAHTGFIKLSYHW